MILQYGRWIKLFSPNAQVTHVDFVTKDAVVIRRPTFAHQPAQLVYDHHGYEQILMEGEVVAMVRFTPTQAGIYHYRAMHNEVCVEEGQFTCDRSNHPGYVQVSERDPRYFAYSDGTAFCLIGLCLVGPPRYALPQGMEHFAIGEGWGTLGCADYHRWFRLLHENGANFVRVWLSHPYFSVETEIAGEFDLAAFTRLDKVVELARQYDIRLKLCFDHFRTFEAGATFAKVIKHPDDGRSPVDMDEWLQSPEWRALWLRKVEAYLARYGGDPTVAVWELWNEMDCVRGRWEFVREWTRDMLREIKRMAPKQLVVNSLGSFDDERKQGVQDDFLMDEMDFQQVHRYLDQGAPWEISTLDPVAFSVDAIQRTRRPDRPILLAETGAVNDRHTGPFRYYRHDNQGIIFNDTTFPAFFAGAAGTGQIWHWDQYVDQKNLWHFFRPFASMLSSVQLDAEGFTPVDLSSDQVWFLGLQGRQHFLAWVRSKGDAWYRSLRDETKPGIVEDAIFDLGSLNMGQVTIYWPWGETAGEATWVEGKLHLPPFQHGLMIKIAYA